MASQSRAIAESQASRPRAPNHGTFSDSATVKTATGERPNGRRGYTRYARYPGRVTFIPPSIIPAFSAHNSFQVVLCLLDAAFVNGVRDELDQTLTEELHGQVNMDDRPLRQLITLLAVEAGQGGMMGHLYADHLAHSIAIRLSLLARRRSKELVQELRACRDTF
jgi:hypothetical protein